MEPYCFHQMHYDSRGHVHGMRMIRRSQVQGPKDPGLYVHESGWLHDAGAF